MNDSSNLGTAESWHARARALRPGGLALINGELKPAASGVTFNCISPIDGRLLAAVAACDTPDVDAAVAAARAAFERRDWADRAPAERKQVLLRFAGLVEQAGPELALLETLDVGKPIRDSITVDVAATVRCLRWYAEAIDKIYDQVAPTGPQSLALVTREPMGVVGAIPLMAAETSRPFTYGIPKSVITTPKGSGLACA